MKKFVNNPNNFVREILEGLVTANPRKLKWIPKYKPLLIRRLKTGMTFIKLSHQLGNIRPAAWPYYKMIFKVLFKNPGAIEPAINLSAMFIHFHKQSKFIIKRITQEIESLESRQNEKSEMVLRDHYVSKFDFTEECQEL